MSGDRHELGAVRGLSGLFDPAGDAAVAGPASARWSSERAGVLNMSIERHDADLGPLPLRSALGPPAIRCSGLLIGIIAVQPVALLQAVLRQHAARQPDRVRHRHQHPGTRRHHAGLSRDLRGAVARGNSGPRKIKPPLLGDIPVLGACRVRTGLAAVCRHRADRADRMVLRYTSIGLAIHAAGAEPKAVDKSGLSVTRIRYGCVLFAGFMASLAAPSSRVGDIHTFTRA